MKKIVWEPFYDHTDESILEEEEGFQHDESYPSDPMLDLANAFPPEMMRVITPMGEYFATDPNRPTAMFSCWIAHTNFPITDGIFNVLDNMDGIGALKITSRYSFFIGIGKLFDAQQVRHNINRFLINDNVQFNEDQDAIICDLIEEVKNAETGRFAVFISDDRETIEILKMSECKDEKDYYDKLSVLNTCVNGNLITYDVK